MRVIAIRGGPRWTRGGA